MTIATLVLSWPLMVLPTLGVWYYHGSLYWAWTFASVYIITIGVMFCCCVSAGMEVDAVIEQAQLSPWMKPSRTLRNQSPQMTCGSNRGARRSRFSSACRTYVMSRIIGISYSFLACRLLHAYRIFRT